VTTAGQVRDKVDQILAATGAAKVDVITHSMGGLSSRYYVKNLGGDLKVDEWVSLGGPNHGTDTANFCWDTSCGEMRVGSSFLTALNAGDETPGAVRYGTWWSPCDNVINPDSSVALSGASNTRTACLGHSALYEDATVFGQVRDFVR
jgi:triacylglycerol lipase